MPRFNKRTDKNQSDIIRDLRAIPGVTVEPDHDDILVGFQGDTFWFEIKIPDKASKRKKGTINESALRDSQKRLRNEFTGHYSIVWTLEQILEEIGICINIKGKK